MFFNQRNKDNIHKGTPKGYLFFITEYPYLAIDRNKLGIL